MDDSHLPIGKTAIPHVAKLEFAIPLHTTLYHNYTK